MLPWIAVPLAAALLLVACDDSPVVAPEGAALFELRVSGETFRAAVTDPEEIERLQQRLDDGVQGVVIGELRRGDGGFNGPWSWHWAPSTVHAADAAIEVCDGRPSMVEEDLDYWIDTVGSFCPWGAEVVGRETK